MNIMLVSVTERTHEIGLRLSIGARGWDVLMQFLVEAVVLSLLGGVIGIGVGFGLSRGLTQFLEWPTSVSPDAVALAFAVTAVTGVFFGFYPARKAAGSTRSRRCGTSSRSGAAARPCCGSTWGSGNHVATALP